MNIKKRIISVIMAGILAVSLSACATADSGKNKSSVDASSASSIEASSETSSADTTSITDREGIVLTIPENVESIISMAPSVTETLVNLGLGDKLVAIDDYSKGIAGVATDLPSFDIMAPDAEKILALNADLIFASGMSKANGTDPFSPMVEAGSCVTYVPSSETIADIMLDIQFIGDVTKSGDKAKTIVENMRKQIEALTTKLQIPATKKKVYFENSAAPAMYTTGSGTFINEMLDILGLENIFADQTSWVGVSEEVVVEKNPDIIFTSVNYIENPVDEIIGRNGFSAINAVKNKQVFQIATDAASRPNENIIKALLEMAELAYPEQFAK